MPFCECGCGIEAVKRYVWGHNPSPRKSYESGSTAKERLHSRVRVDDNGCFIWHGTKRGDYGTIIVDGRRIYAHRLSYDLYVGEIAAGEIIHHICGQKLCVKPSHLEKRDMAEHTKMHQTRRRSGVPEWPETRPASGGPLPKLGRPLVFTALNAQGGSRS